MDPYRIDPQGQLVIRAPDHANATIDVQYHLFIGNERVPLSPVQQSDVARFYQHARQLPAAGRAIGHSVADSVLVLLGIVWHDVIHGHFDRIGADITQRVSPVATALGPFCRQLAATVSVQQQLTGDLPRFAPYAVLKPSSSRRCEAHTVSQTI